MTRARHKHGSVVFDKRRKVWNYLYCDNGVRRTRTIGTQAQFRSKAAAWAEVESIRPTLKPNISTAPTITSLTLTSLVNSYRAEKMPVRATTKRGYNAWLNNHVLPAWGARPLTDVQPRAVELWLHSLDLSPKSKAHIRGLLTVLWDYAMWRGDVPTQRNPMELVTIKGATKRTRHPRSLIPEQFQSLLTVLGDDLCWRTILMVALGFGLRVSEVLGLQWRDIDWLGQELHIQRGVVKQVTDNVKSSYSAKPMPIAADVLDVLKQWKQATQFSQSEDWIFASPVKLGRQPLSYTHVWETLDAAAEKAGIGHISSHSFRHTFRSWLDVTGTPVGVQQRMMRHADIRTTMNVYGDAATAEMRQASEKVARMALPDCKTDCKTAN